MKKFYLTMAIAAMVVAGSGCTDKDLQDRVDTLESTVSSMNTQIQTLQTAVSSGITVTSVTTTDNGYKISFSNGTTATISNGKDGDTLFASVKMADGKVTVTLSDGTAFVIPVSSAVADIKSVSSLNGTSTKITYFETSDAAADLKFMVKPASAMAALKTTLESGAGKIYALGLKAQTKSLADEVSTLAVKEYTIGEDGLLTAKVDASALDAAVFSEGAANIAVCLADATTEIASDFVNASLECTGLSYAGVTYHIVKMADGKTWMAENLRYIPEGLTPCNDLTNVKAGIYYPVQLNADGNAAEFTTSEDVIKSNGYLYQAEIALGLKIGDITSDDQAKALEGAQGICPDGWHVPTIADITGLVGKAVSPIATNEDAPYYDKTKKNGTMELLNADGFNAKAWGAVTIASYTAAKGTIMGYLKTVSGKIASGMTCGSSYAATSTSGIYQFYGFMPMENNGSFNGCKVNYTIAAPVRCVKNN